MTTIKISLLISGLLLISACGSIKQVAVVSHKTSSLKEIVAPTPVPEIEDVVLPKEPEQQVAALSEPVVIEVEPPPMPRHLPATSFEPETAAVPEEPVQQVAALPEPEVIEVEPLPEPRRDAPLEIEHKKAAVPEEPPQEVAALTEPVTIAVEPPPQARVLPIPEPLPVPGSPPPPVPAEVKPSTPSPPPLLSDIFFDFDQFFIRKDEIANVEGNAELLNGHYQDSSLLIEGHCDERGTIEYNLVLGERWAQAVKTYLVDLGIAASRIQTISYGKEKPFCTQHSVQCWQQNRRTHFVLR